MKLKVWTGQGTPLLFGGIFWDIGGPSSPPMVEDDSPTPNPPARKRPQPGRGLPWWTPIWALVVSVALGGIVQLAK